MPNTKKTHFTLYFILLAVGFVLIALDMDVKTNIKYPHKYENSSSVTGEFQYYNIDSLYGATCTYKLMDTSSKSTRHPLVGSETNVSSDAVETKVIDKVFFDNIHIDIFNDIVGFICIFVACFSLRKANKRFSLASLSAVSGIILNIVLAVLPFIINGESLCIAGMIIGMVYLACNVLTTFLFCGGLFKMCPQVCCRDERKWGKMTWFISFALQILTTFVFWLGSDFGALYTLGQVLEVIMIIDIIGFFIIMKRTLPYLEKSYIKSFNFSSTNS